MVFELNPGFNPTTPSLPGIRHTYRLKTNLEHMRLYMWVNSGGWVGGLMIFLPQSLECTSANKGTILGRSELT